jgi:hypothetical protein
VDNGKEGNKKIDKIQNCINYGVVPVFLGFLNNPYDQLGASVLKIIGNISLGDREQVNYLMELGIVDRLEELLQSEKKVYRKEGCWVLSNLVGCSNVEVEKILSREGLVKKLMRLLDEDLPDVKTEICYIFSNAIVEGDHNKMYCFVNEIGLLGHLAGLVGKMTDVKLILSWLECLHSIL